MTAPLPQEVIQIAALRDPVLRNLRITECYHRISAAFAARTGRCANWCTFALWASRQAGGVETMMAGGGDVLHKRFGGAPAVQQAHVAPGFSVGETVELVAGRHTRLAARAGIEIDLEGVLFAVARRGRGQEIGVIPRPPVERVVVVLSRKAFDGREILLGQQVAVDESQRRIGRRAI